MDARRVAVAAGLIGGTGWLIKVLVMALHGGPDENSVPESIGYFVGLFGMLTAAAATGSYVARRRLIPVRVAAAVAGVVALAAPVGLGQAALTALPGDAWVQHEAIFAVIGVLAVAIAGWFALQRRGDRPVGA